MKYSGLAEHFSSSTFCALLVRLTIGARRAAFFEPGFELLAGLFHFSGVYAEIAGDFNILVVAILFRQPPLEQKLHQRVGILLDRADELATLVNRLVCPVVGTSN